MRSASVAASCLILAIAACGTTGKEKNTTGAGGTSAGWEAVEPSLNATDPNTPWRTKGHNTGGFFLDAPGSYNIQLVLKPGQDMPFAGLTLRVTQETRVVSGVLEDGTFYIDRAGIVGKDRNGKPWASREATIGGRKVHAFYRQS